MTDESISDRLFAALNTVVMERHTILDGAILESWILQALLVGSYKNLNVASIKQNGIRAIALLE